MAARSEATRLGPRRESQTGGVAPVLGHGGGREVTGRCPRGCLACPWDEGTHTHFLDLAHSFFQFFTKTGTTCSDVSSLFRDQRSVLSSGWR